eukprot:4056307-Ditylum_brightwellii.AAC.1
MDEIILRHYQGNTEEEEGCLCMDLDSVDGLPSVHLSLVSDGECLYSDYNDNGCSGDDMPWCHAKSREILDLVEPYIENVILPTAQNMIMVNDERENCSIGSRRDKHKNGKNKSPTLRISDVFLRRYGDNDVLQDASSPPRCSIPAHYDVYSSITAVVALDDTAQHGDEGLYTVLSSTSPRPGNNGASRDGGIDHPALRRYFPLSAGDAILHSWDVQHGVNIMSNSNRTSLIVWFVADDERGEEGGNRKEEDEVERIENEEEQSEWFKMTEQLMKRLEEAGMESSSAVKCSLTSLLSLYDQYTNKNYDDDLLYYVLGIALESAESIFDVEMTPSSSSSMVNTHGLYIKSCSVGNTNAMHRLGTLCKYKEVGPKDIFDIVSMLERKKFVDPVKEGKISLQDPTTHDDHAEEESYLQPCNKGGIVDEEHVDSDSIARQLFYEAAKHGNSKAQIALAEELLYIVQNGDGAHHSSFNVDNSRLLVIAAVLLVLARQQDNHCDDTSSASSAWKKLEAAVSANEQNFSSSQKNTEGRS